MSSVDDETIMEVLAGSEEPRLTTTEIAGELPLARGTVRSRLQTLADEGRLDREREGRDVVWFLPERADESPAAAEPETEPGAESETEGEEAGESGEREPGEREPDEDDQTGTDGSTTEPMTAVTERGEPVSADEESTPSAAAATGDPARRDDTLVRAAIAGVLLALVYYAIRHIGGGS